MATLSAFSRTLARPAVRAASAARRVMSRPSASQPLAAPAKRSQRGSEFFLFCFLFSKIDGTFFIPYLSSLA